MSAPLRKLLARLPPFIEGADGLVERVPEAGSRIGLSDDPICAEAVALTLRYARYVITERRNVPCLGDGQAGR